MLVYAPCEQVFSIPHEFVCAYVCAYVCAHGHQSGNTCKVSCGTLIPNWCSRTITCVYRVCVCVYVHVTNVCVCVCMCVRANVLPCAKCFDHLPIACMHPPYAFIHSFTPSPSLSLSHPSQAGPARTTPPCPKMCVCVHRITTNFACERVCIRLSMCIRPKPAPTLHVCVWRVHCACLWARLWWGIRPVIGSNGPTHMSMCICVWCPHARPTATNFVCTCVRVHVSDPIPCPLSCSFDAFHMRMHTSLCPFVLLLSPPRSSRAYT
jgi:hypothetical protein